MGGEIKRDREAGLPLLQQIVIALVGFLRRGESGELTHRPEFSAIHIAVNAAGVWKLARLRILIITRAIHRVDRNSANCRKLPFGGFHHCQLQLS